MTCVLKEAIQNLPVVINNYYGDPLIQWENTIQKLKTLQQEKHKGIVSIITRGIFNLKKIQELKEASIGLNFLVLYSFSGLPYEIEPVDEAKKFKSLELLINQNVPCLVCLRPLIPGLNTSEDQLKRMFEQFEHAGVKNVCIAGFRGDDALVKKMNIVQKKQWSLRVKIMDPETSRNCNILAKKHKIQLSKRVACGVALALQRNKSHNPYRHAPLLAGCMTCSLQETCLKSSPVNLELLATIKNMGYDLQYKEVMAKDECTVQPENRVNCPSCCTACWFSGNERLQVANEKISLADLTFLRFLFGIQAVKEGVFDQGNDTAIAKVVSKFIDTPVHFVNSWYVWSNQIKNCFGCKYCITEAYNIKETENGCSPLTLYNLLQGKLNEKK